MSDKNAKVALITGASRGIGRAIALALAEHGWWMVVNYRGAAAAAADTLRAIESRGSQAILVQADVSSAPDRDRLVDEALAQFGHIDLLVNNAGIAPRRRLDILETSEASFLEVIGVNLIGPFFLTQRVAREMIASIRAGVIQDPKIVNIGSISAFASSTNRGEYCISKAGVAMMTALYADRLAEYGINVYEVRPGIIDTDMTAAVRGKYDELIAAGLTPIARWGQPEDVAQGVAALAEGAFPFSTGEIIHVDGGFHLHRL